MLVALLSALGGVGLFLIGMLLLTDGLKAMAGHRLRNILTRFTSTPTSGAITGALATAAVQSSSATTVAAVGFVASGLLTFPNALGIIFGANIGTTLTGWIVAILGFKLNLGQVVLPVIFFAALLKLSKRGQAALLGQAIAGFCLIFIGIEQMKDGLEALEGVAIPTLFPPDTLWGRLKLLMIGVLITLVTQSSSAGVATALAALGAGAINFPQAAVLVIGMDVGTTFTAVLATLGGGTMAKRTGFAHVIYNVMTAVMALFLLTPFMALTGTWITGSGAQTALVAFHSFFNFLGVVLILPFARPFARLVELLVPEKGSYLTRSLDPMVLREPAEAVDLAKIAVHRISSAAAQSFRKVAGAPEDAGDVFERGSLDLALSETRDYLEKIKLPDKEDTLMEEIKDMFHILDHLARLLYRCDQTSRINALGKDRRLKRLQRVLLAATAGYDSPDDTAACEALLDRVRQLMNRQRVAQRDRIIAGAATGSMPVDVAGTRLDAMRWLHRVAYHLWRIRVHLNALETIENLGSDAKEKPQSALAGTESMPPTDH